MWEEIETETRIVKEMDDCLGLIDVQKQSALKDLKGRNRNDFDEKGVGTLGGETQMCKK